MTSLPVPLLIGGLLVASNIFMTVAEYGHLPSKSAPLWTVILISGGIALFDYALRVPANRIGHGHFSAAKLKTIREFTTLSVFAVIFVRCFKKPLQWNHLAGFGIITLGGFFIFHNRV